MPNFNSMPDGLYEQLLSAADLQAVVQRQRPVELKDADPDDAHFAIAQYVDVVVRNALATVRGGGAIERQVVIANRVLEALGQGTDDRMESSNLATPLQCLTAVGNASPTTALPRPDTPLARSALLTGSPTDPALSTQLQKEIASAEHVDILCSFIKWGGLRLILDQLKELTSTPWSGGPRLRVITTSYMGATDPRAVEELSKLPNTQIRVSYDTTRTRLHAKAYVIHRPTGFGSAYVGSANLSRAAMTEGLEWVNKISQYELPYLWQRVTATFESYWNATEFEPYRAEDTQRFQEAIDQERQSGGSSGIVASFDLRPFPFQLEILEAIQQERESRNKFRHLVVAATGTGKTMIAAFDYRRWCQEKGTKPRLLFVAHRQEILEQALGTFRAVLRDQNFGDLLVGGARPAQRNHLFCSIQSYRTSGLRECHPGEFEYIVVDEFHHAAAGSYRLLLDNVQPQVLLGLTATPERHDGLDILHWFQGESTAEIRLPDAIYRKLLSPFHYFGVADSVDLRSVPWVSGRYSDEALTQAYCGNTVRADLILQKIQEYVLAPRRMRALGFCASVEHANFMAKFCNDRGLPALSLSGESASEVRQSAQEKLRQREVNVLFVVDLYNEGVDIPEIDTVLFLRPTESLTVYLQQLGRGLRLHPEKDCLTVLDFIGAHRKEFRFASRIYALTGNALTSAAHQVEAGMPSLPAGCAFNLERVARERVLNNIQEATPSNRAAVLQRLRALGAAANGVPSLAEGLSVLGYSLAKLFSKGTWSQLLAEAGLRQSSPNPDEALLSKGFARLSHIDDPVLIKLTMTILEKGLTVESLIESDCRRLMMVMASIWMSDGAEMTLEAALDRLRLNPAACSDLLELLRYRLKHSEVREAPAPHASGPTLSLHASYTRDEILMGIGHWDMQRRPSFREGTLHLEESKIDAFFVTLNKSLEAYSPTTMYEDYIINEKLFHWQTPSTVSNTSPTAQRYINHVSRGYTPLLFVRDSKGGPDGTNPYAFFGSVTYQSHQASRPVSIVWELQECLPARLQRWIRM